jgi:hypothetical protein
MGTTRVDRSLERVAQDFTLGFVNPDPYWPQECHSVADQFHIDPHNPLEEGQALSTF